MDLHLLGYLYLYLPLCGSYLLIIRALLGGSGQGKSSGLKDGPGSRNPAKPDKHEA